MKRIVAGTDGSAGSANALRWAAQLAAQQGAEVVVMTGWEPTDSELPPGRVEELRAEQERLLEEWSAPARLDDVPVRTIVERGDPRPAILEVAEREGADLVVVGRVGQSTGPGLLAIGSMAEWLGHHADRPIAIIGGAVNVRTEGILIGVDGSEGSRAAVAWVRDLDGSSDLRIVVAMVEAHVVEWTPASAAENWRRDVEQRIRDDFASDLTAAGIDVEPRALHGVNAADALLQAAEEERVDAIVVGARGLGGFLGLRIGGVALKVLHRADRPVVVVPTP
jgi:nucleotide-binding universal stress UspA family protein